jgi:hypothetical protein
MPIDLFKQAGIAPHDSGKPAPRDLFAEAGINPNLIERSGGTFKWGNRQVPAYDASNYADRGRTFKGAMGVLAGFSDPILGLVQRDTELAAKVGLASPKTREGVQRIVDERQEQKQTIGGSSLSFKAGEFAGQMLPTTVVPGGNATNMLARGAANAGIGAAVGYAQPTTTNENPYVNALIGGAGGAALSGIEGGVNALARSRLPERLYGSAVKLPLARKRTKLLPGQEITVREAAIQEGLRSEVPPSEYGLAKARQIRQRTGKAYGEKLAERKAALPAKEIRIKVDDVLDEGLAEAYKTVANTDNIAGNKAILDTYRQTLKSGRKKYITPTEANELKGQIYKDIHRVRESKSPSTRFEQLAKKGAALQLDKALDAMFPELEGINAKYGARKDLVEALEKYTGMTGNKNLIGLDTKVLLRPHMWPAAVLDATPGHPQIKARLGFLLNKVRQSKGLPLIGDRYITRQISKGIPIAAEAEE